MTIQEQAGKIVNHIEANKREFDLVEINYCVDSWWVKLRKGNIESRPAVHEDFAHAYAIALAQYEEAQNGDKK